MSREPLSRACSQPPIRAKNLCVPADSCSISSWKCSVLPSSSIIRWVVVITDSPFLPETDLMVTSEMPRSASSISLRIRAFCVSLRTISETVSEEAAGCSIIAVNFSRNHLYALSVCGRFQSLEETR